MSTPGLSLRQDLDRLTRDIVLRQAAEDWNTCGELASVLWRLVTLLSRAEMEPRRRTLPYHRRERTRRCST